MMDNKTGWARTAMLERLYPLTGTFEKAKLLFDKYYTKVNFLYIIYYSYPPTGTSTGATISNSSECTPQRK